MQELHVQTAAMEVVQHFWVLISIQNNNFVSRF